MSTPFFKIKKTVLGTFAIIVLVMTMISFGLSPMDAGFNKTRKDYAVKIGDQEIKHEEFYQEKRNIEQRYRQYFGENYAKIMEMMGQGVNQQAIDNITNRAVLGKVSDNSGLVGSDTSATKKIFKELFAGGSYDEALFKNFLMSQGMTSRQYEQQVKASLGREQLIDFVSNAVKPSMTETRNRLARTKTRYKVASIAFDPSAFAAEAPAPEQKAIEEFYNRHKSEYEEPMKLSYDYVVVNEKAFPDLVQIPQADIDVYYADHQNDFKTEDERKLSLITVKLPEGVAADKATEEQKLELKKRAEELLARVKAGEAFDVVARTVAEDKLAQEKGGDFGWVSKKDFKGLNGKVSGIVFTSKLGAAEARLVDDAGVFYVVRIDEEKPSIVKPIDQVKTEIENILKKEQYPSYLSAKANELLDNFRKANSAGKQSFSDFVQQNNLPLQTASLLSDGQDPEPGLKGITSSLLDTPDLTSQVVELDNYSVLAFIKEVKQPEIKSLEAVKEKIVATLKNESSAKIAEDKANSLIKEIRENKYPDLKAAAAATNLTVKEYDEFPASQPSKDLGDQKLIEAITLKSSPVAVLDKPYTISGKKMLFQIVSVRAPEEAEINKELNEYVNTVQSENAEIAGGTLISTVKAELETDVDPAIMN